MFKVCLPMVSTSKHPLLKRPTVAAGNLALSLDFDGVLVELADHPDLIVLNENLTSLLANVNTTLAGRLIYSHRQIPKRHQQTSAPDFDTDLRKPRCRGA